MTSVNLSLISHTNAGKTTLARTLLQQDVGEVRDAAHVTDVATGYLMVQAGDDSLMLWDTPGFGDTRRLVTRLRLAGNPIGWLLSQVWDRFRDRPLWSSQQAVRNARDEADIILYLVNAGEDPAGAAYVPLEMEVLGFIGKPVVLLLNQVGPPSPEARADEARWAEHLVGHDLVRGTLTLDAFARCWVQELTLLQQVHALLPPTKQAPMKRLLAAWEQRNLQRFGQAMAILAAQLASAIRDRQEIGEQRWTDRLASAVRDPLGEGSMTPAGKRAVGELGERLARSVHDSTDALIALHGLEGRAARQVLSRVARDVTESAPAREGVAAVLGGIASGAAGGLVADLAAGGLTLGGGMLIGGILGAVGAGSAARGYNLVRGDKSPAVRWSEDAFLGFVQAALLRYLAVAHFGRGRGEWEEGEHPPVWQELVAAEVTRHRARLRQLWSRSREADEPELVRDLEGLLAQAGRSLLTTLYPEASRLFSGEAPVAAAEVRQESVPAAAAPQEISARGA